MTLSLSQWNGWLTAPHTVCKGKAAVYCHPSFPPKAAGLPCRSPTPPSRYTVECKADCSMGPLPAGPGQQRRPGGRLPSPEAAVIILLGGAGVRALGCRGGATRVWPHAALQSPSSRRPRAVLEPSWSRAGATWSHLEPYWSSYIVWSGLLWISNRL